MCRSIVSNVCIYVSVDRVECVHRCVGRSCRMCAYMCRSIVCIDVSVDRVECVHRCVSRSCAYMCRSIVSNVCIDVSVDRVHRCVGGSCRMCA